MKLAAPPPDPIRRTSGRTRRMARGKRDEYRRDMKRPANAPSTDADMNAAPEDEPPPTLAQVSRLVARFVAFLRPNAVGCRLMIDVPDGDEDDAKIVTDRIFIPIAATDDQDKVAHGLEFLGRFKPGTWVGGKEFATGMGISFGSGHWRRFVAAVKATGKVESNNNLGYRIIQADVKGRTRDERGTNEN